MRDIRKGIQAASSRYVEGPAIREWINVTYELWNERNRLAHSIWMDVYDASDLTLHSLLTQRGFDELSTDFATLDSLLERTLSVITVGHELSNVLFERAIANASVWGGPFELPEI